MKQKVDPNVPGNFCLPLAQKMTNLQISSILSARGAKEDVRTPRSSRQTLKLCSSRQEAIEKRRQLAEMAEDGRCAICQSSENVLALIPCGHKVICRNCLGDIDLLPRCPVCNLSYMGATEAST